MARKPKTAPPIRATVAQQRNYERALRREILNPVANEFESRLLRAEKSYFSIKAELDKIRFNPAVVEVKAGQIASTAVREMQEYHKRKFTRTMTRLLGVDIGPFMTELRMQGRMTAAVKRHVDLIKTIPPRYHARLSKELIRLQTEGAFDQQALRKVLHENYQSSGYNLRRLTKDQTGKLMGEFNEVRQTDVGIQKYQWSSSADDRVRLSHVANDGQIFAWNSPPIDTGHPGNDIQCRCAALAIIPDPIR